MLDKLSPTGFEHNIQSLRVVDVIEKEGLSLIHIYHVLYGCLAVALDARTLPPLDFSARFKALKESLRKGDVDDLRELFAKAEEVGTGIYEKIQNLGEGELSLIHI